MAGPNPETSTRDNDVAMNELLEQYNQYIVALAWKSVLRRAVAPESLSFAIDELAQNVRLKLWSAAQKHSIAHLKAYIRRIVRNEAVNILRQQKPISQLPVNEEGELYQGHLLATTGGVMRDSLEEIEQEEIVADLVAAAAEMIKRLPPRQQRAIICSLRDRIDDTLPLLEALMDRGIDVESMNWPEEEEDVQRLKASLPAVRKKLRLLLYRFGPVSSERTGQ